MELTSLFESIYDFSKNERPMYAFAKRRHDDTKAIRLATNEPYWTHPEAVAKIAVAYGGTSDEIKTALAHDTMEDTGASFEDIKEKFGSKIANLVKEVTNEDDVLYNLIKDLGDKDLGKEKYMNHKLLHLSKSALFVKLCDILHNVLDHPRDGQCKRMAHNIDYLISNKELDDRETELVDSIIMALSKRRNK